MSGANTVATVTCLLETGMVTMQEPKTVVKLDAPAGLVTAYLKCENGKCKSVRFHNVPAFVFATDKEISVPELGTVKVDIAYGGMIYVLVDAASVGLKIKTTEGARLVKVGERIKRAVMEQTDPTQYTQKTLVFTASQSSSSRSLCMSTRTERQQITLSLCLPGA